MSEINALIEKLKAATGPDRALDLALATELAPDVLVLRQRDDDSGADPYTHWEYTGSIDDGLALVEKMRPDILWVVESRDDDARGYRGALYSRDFTKSSEAYAPTAPLAILLSLLLALSQEETK